jgi:hypothetical protein
MSCLLFAYGFVGTDVATNGSEVFRKDNEEYYS